MADHTPARKRREPNWALLTPLVWGPILPLSRQMMNATKTSPPFRLKVYMGLVVAGMDVRPLYGMFCS